MGDFTSHMIQGKRIIIHGRMSVKEKKRVIADIDKLNLSSGKEDYLEFFVGDPPEGYVRRNARKTSWRR